MTDAPFDQAVRAALNAKDGTAYKALVERAGTYTGRWQVLIRNCETPAGLAWLEGQIAARKVESARLPLAIAKRRAELAEGAPT